MNLKDNMKWEKESNDGAAINSSLSRKKAEQADEIGVAEDCIPGASKLADLLTIPSLFFNIKKPRLSVHSNKT